MPRLARPFRNPFIQEMTKRITSMNFGIFLKEYWKVFGLAISDAFGAFGHLGFFEPKSYIAGLRLFPEGLAVRV